MKKIKQGDVTIFVCWRSRDANVDVRENFTEEVTFGLRLEGWKYRYLGAQAAEKS